MYLNISHIPLYVLYTCIYEYLQLQCTIHFSIRCTHDKSTCSKNRCYNCALYTPANMVTDNTYTCTCSHVYPYICIMHIFTMYLHVILAPPRHMYRAELHVGDHECHINHQIELRAQFYVCRVYNYSQSAYPGSSDTDILFFFLSLPLA